MKVFSINRCPCSLSVILIILYFQYNTNDSAVWHHSCCEFQTNRGGIKQSKGNKGSVPFTGN